jgi:Fe-S cluster assembly scaffold protein SufB
MLSISEKVTETTQKLSEPEWLLDWRMKRGEFAQTLPRELKYGLGISGLLPKNESDFSGTADYHVDASKGLEVYTWREGSNQEEIAPILKGLMESDFFPIANNYFSGVAQALFRSGLVIYVQPNMSDGGELVTEKLTLDTKVPIGSSSDIVIVIAKEGAKLDLHSSCQGETLTNGGGEQCVFARTLIVLTEEGADVRVTQTSTLSKGTLALMSARGIVAAHSSVSWTESLLNDADVKSETENLLIGESARGEITQAVVANTTARYDIFSATKHVASHTTSTIRARGVGAGESRIIYRGLIDMTKGVSAVNGSQEARFLTLSKTAKIDAIPSLDIASKDVQCSHKLSISNVTDGDIFYPRLRGLSETESKALYLEGLFSSVFPNENSGFIMKDIQESLSNI